MRFFIVFVVFVLSSYAGAQQVEPDLTGSVDAGGIAVAIDTDFPDGFFRGAKSLYGNPLFDEWSALANSAKYGDLVAAAEANLLSETPHPLASYVWSWAQYANGELTPGNLPQMPESLAPVLEPAARYYLYSRIDRPDLALSVGDALINTADRNYHALWNLHWTADSMGQAALAQRASQTLLEAYPYDFAAGFTAFIGQIEQKNLWIRWFSDRRAVADAPAGLLLKTLLKWNNRTEADELQLIDAWLDVEPTDREALKRRGYALHNLGRYEEALTELEKASSVFFTPAVRRRAVILARLGRDDEARQLIAEQVALDTPPELRGAETARRIADAFKVGLNLGVAREVALKGLDGNPGYLPLVYELARVLIEEDYAKEVPALIEPLLQQNANDYTLNHQMMVAYDKIGNNDAILSLYKSYREAGGLVSATLLNTLRSAYNGLMRFDEAAAVYDVLAKFAPLEYWAMGNTAWSLAQAERYDEAFDRISEIAPKSPEDAWTMARLGEYGQKAGREAEAIALLEELATAYPYSEAVWTQLAAAGDPLVVWRRAVERAPYMAFPRVQLADAIVAADGSKYMEAVSLLDDSLQVIDESSPSQRAKVVQKIANILRVAFKDGHDADPSKFGMVVAAADSARALGLSELDYWYTLFDAYSTYGKVGDGRATAALKSLQHSKNKSDMLRDAVDLIDRATTENATSTSKAGFYYLKDIERRFPRWDKVYRSQADYHSKWGGSLLTAIRAAQKVEQLTGDPMSETVASAYSSLGATRRGFEDRYARKGSISKSDRYVDWFRRARQGAYEPQPVFKTIDLEKGVLVKVGADGIEIEQHYDTVFGNVRYVRYGSAFVKLDYDKFGRLVSISTNEGLNFEFEWQEGTVPFLNQKVRVFRNFQGHEIEIEYNDDNRPSQLRSRGIGTLDIAYNSAGNIEKLQTEVEGDREAHEVSAYVSSAFEGLDSILETVQAANHGNYDALLELGEDPEGDRLSQVLSSIEENDHGDFEAKWQEAALELVEHLVEKSDLNPSYRTRAEVLLEQLFVGDGSDGVSAGQNRRLAALRAVALFHELQSRVRPNGLPKAYWNTWQGMLDFLNTLHDPSAEENDLVGSVKEAILAEPLKLLSDAGWLDRSFLSNDSFWRQYSVHEMFPKALADSTKVNDILVRSNGHVVAASNVGIAVLRRGYWEWFGFDENSKRFSRTLEARDVGTSSAVYALAEAADGALWLGMAGGLARISDSYELQPHYQESGTGGLPKGSLRKIAVQSSGLAVGGVGGVSILDNSGSTVAGPFDIPTHSLHAMATGSDTGDFLVGGSDGLFHLNVDAQTRLTSFQVTDTYYSEEKQEVYVLRGTDVLRAQWNDLTSFEQRLVPFGGQETILATASPYGLGEIETEDGPALAVYTDRGVSLALSRYFENLSVPRTDRPIPIRAASSADGRIYFATDEGVAAIEYGQVTVLSDEYPPMDLLTDSELNLTYVARGEGFLDVVSYEDGDLDWQTLAYIRASHLDQLANGDLLTNDGTQIVRIPQGSDDVFELFSVIQTGEDGQRISQSVTSLLAASDGTIWVTAGASVFRWIKGMGEPEEFSIYKDAADFRGNSQMLSRVVETVDGRILLIASSEGHLRYKGKRLAGGLFEYKDGNFVETDIDHSQSDWFMTGYTRISEQEAIVGTTGGFAQYRNGSLREFDTIEDESYLSLRQKRPALFLGTDGAELGEGLWLFGSASGVVGYKDGNWIDTDRLNGMLPRYEFANYGARAVQAIETDAQGRVYVATDFGLTVYDPIGAGPETLLLSEGQQNMVFAEAARQEMADVSDVLRDALPADSNGAALLEKLRESRRKVKELENLVTNTQSMDAEGTDKRKLERNVLRAKQQELALLSRIENENPLLVQMIALNPLDLAAAGASLPEDVVVAQYLPTENVLYINMVSRDGIVVREVNVSRKTLMAQALLASRALGAQAGGGEAPEGASALLPGMMSARSGPGSLGLEDNLAWLYDQLLRPVEAAVGESQTLIVSPAGPLSYVPFAALIRSKQADRIEYAIERFDLATAPSLYALEQVANRSPSLAFSNAVFGDPDGTLPAARLEAMQVASVLESEDVVLKIGDEADYETLNDVAADSRFVHLAMHGKLDHITPAESYLLLANGRRMQLPEIMTLPLNEAELVFLSACETGIGRDGLEFRTIAHAFLYAGAPAVMATLWQVNDEATRNLALAFYNARLDGKGNAAALAEAQRQLIAGGGTYAKPGFWAAFTLLGKT